MGQVDFLTVTGSANNVRAGQNSGTPNACVSAGNVVSIVDLTADLEEAARKIHESKTFDYGTSCSNDNSVVIEAPVYEAMVEALHAGGRVPLRRRGTRPLARIHVARRGQAQPQDLVQGALRDRRRGWPGGPGGQRCHVLHGRGQGHREGRSLLRREAGRGAHHLQGRRLRRGVRDNQRNPGPRGPWAFLRSAHHR